jgi:exodeoxyribonuclease V alpha subunit
MIVKNDYNLNVFNGDVGHVARINRKAKEVEVQVYGDPDLMIAIPFKNVGNLLRLAYACTVHKAQGLEYDVIVMPVVESFRHQLQRNLLYTAVTRARKRVLLVGSRAALGMAVVNDKEDQRNTLFRDRLVATMGTKRP